MQQVASKWDAELYSGKHSFVYEHGESLIAFLDPKKDERILDLGCGSGQLTNAIQNLCEYVVGIDSSFEMIQTAKSNFPFVNFQLGDATDFHFEQKFNAIFSNAALHWVTNYQEAIERMYENLSYGGRIVLEFGGKGNVEFILKQVQKSLEDRGYKEQSKLNLWYFPSISEYTMELESKGFEVTFAHLYDRPTELADEGSGIIDWLDMFGSSFFKGVKEVDVESIKNEVQANLMPHLFKNGKWYADYRRIRILAYKQQN